MCKKWENECAQQYGDTYRIKIKQHGRNFLHSTSAVWASSLIVTKSNQRQSPSLVRRVE